MSIIGLTCPLCGENKFNLRYTAFRTAVVWCKKVTCTFEVEPTIDRIIKAAIDTYNSKEARS